MSSRIGNRPALRSFIGDGIDSVAGRMDPGAIALLVALADAQDERGVHGGLAAIGTEHARMVLLMALLAEPDEGVVAVARGVGADEETDVLRAELARHLSEPDLVAILTGEAGGLGADDLVDAADGPLRLVSLDGVVGEADVRNLLEVAAAGLAAGGVVLLADAFDPRSPGLAVGAVRFLLEPRGPALVPFATGGERLWLAGSETDAAAYRRRLRARGYPAAGRDEILGHEVLCAIGPPVAPATPT